VDSSKIARVLTNYQPTWTARKGAEELYAAYQRVGLELDEFEGPRYRRIHHIKELIASGRLNDRLRWQESVPA
jgi:hypothetical protein